MAALPSFVCPRCRGPLDHRAAAYECERCRSTYPILLGIPDFRLRSDRYLDLAAERAKAEALQRVAERDSFRGLIRHYYAITDDVPAQLASRYTAYIESAPERGEAILNALPPERDGDVLIDLGCGSGGLLAAAAVRGRRVVGLDIALRWLVCARKRLEELGMAADLVCADVAAPPFADGTFTAGVAADLVEHVHDPAHALGAARSLLRPGGTLWLSAMNRYGLGPHPSTGIWGIGYLPPAWRSRVLTRLRGVDALRHAHLVSPDGIARLARRQGLAVVSMRARRVDARAGAGRPGLERLLIGAYRTLTRQAWADPVLLRIGPAFEMLCRRADEAPDAGGRPCASA